MVVKMIFKGFRTYICISMLNCYVEGWSQFDPRGHDLNGLGRGPLDGSM